MRVMKIENGDGIWRNSYGEYHRVEGPAIERVDGTRKWYMYGIELSESEHKEAAGKLMNHLKNRDPKIDYPDGRDALALMRDERDFVQSTLNLITEAGGVDTEGYFRSKDGVHLGLQNVPLVVTGSGSGAYIGEAVVSRGGVTLNVFIKLYNDTEESEPINTEACVYDKSIGGVPEIPTLLRNYAVYRGLKPHDNIIWNSKKFSLPNPIYIMNEPAGYYSPTGSFMTVRDLIDTYDLETDPRSLFFDMSGGLRRPMFEVFLQILFSVELMHLSGIYHNDLHFENIFLARADGDISVTYGDITMRPTYLVRIYDFDRGFSRECPPKPKDMATCKSMSYHDIETEDCYIPHEHLMGGDTWNVIFEFLNDFQTPGDSNSLLIPLIESVTEGSPIVKMRGGEAMNIRNHKARTELILPYLRKDLVDMVRV